MALWKYEMHVMDCKETREREESLWELGRRGWELVSVVPGDWVNGDTENREKMTWFLKREATHDINF